jgi:hypothetical protein
LSTANVEREDPNPAGVGVGWDSCQGVRAAAIKPCACTHPSTEAGRSYLFGFGAAACMGGPIGERGIEHVLCFWSSCSVFQSLSGWRWDRWREVQKASKRTGRWGLSSCHPVILSSGTRRGVNSALSTIRIAARVTQDGQAVEEACRAMSTPSLSD